MIPRTLPELMGAFKAHDKEQMFSWKEGSSWRSLSWKEFEARVRNLEAHLRDPDGPYGIAKGDFVAFCIYNGPEWHIVRMACAAIGVVTVPVLTEASKSDLEVIFKVSKPKLVIVKDDAQREKVEGVLERLGMETPVLSYTVHTDLGVGPEQNGVDPGVSESDLAMVFFTSGTTSEPKGVLHTHKSLLANVSSCGRAFSFGPDDTTLSFLPVSHVFQHVVDTLALSIGATVAYVERPDQVATALQEVNPTVVVAVPRVFELMANLLPRRVEANLKSKSIVLQKLVPLAMKMGRQNYSGSLGERIPAMVTNPLFRPIRKKVQKEALGSRMRFFVSGGASLPVHVGAFIQGALEVPVYQGWGMTEVAGAGMCNTPGRNVLGSCGTPLPDVEMKLGELPDELRDSLQEGAGEILVRGPMVTEGYFEEPQASEESFRDGWLRTGDVGLIDETGSVWIVDRIKGFIVLESGMKITAQALEDRIRSLCPLIEQIVVVGDARPHLVALVYPSDRTMEGRIEQPYRDADGEWSRAVREAIVAEIRAADLAQHERIRNITLLRDPLSPEDETLTPTQKPRRWMVAERFAGLIDTLYE